MLYDRVFLLARNRKTAPGKRFSIKIRDQSHAKGSRHQLMLAR